MILIGLLGKEGLATECVVRLSNEISTKSTLRKNFIWQAYQNYRIQGDFRSEKINDPSKIYVGTLWGLMINQAPESAPLLEYRLRSIIMGLEFISPQK